MCTQEKLLEVIKNSTAAHFQHYWGVLGQYLPSGFPTLEIKDNSCVHTIFFTANTTSVGIIDLCVFESPTR